MYDFGCEHCDGTVKERLVVRKALRHKGNFVILEDVPIGICDKCGARY
jgi:YgiT-type zinc finger domain-containing protein